MVVQIELNSSSTSVGGGVNLCSASSWSSSLRLSFCRLMPACSRAIRSLTASLSFSSNSSPSDLANSSSMVTSFGASIDLAVTSNSAALPASVSVG